jgi:archaemetzincin
LTSEILNLARLGPAEDYALKKLKLKLSASLQDFQVQVSRPLDTPTMAFDSFRNQYHSTRILAILEEYNPIEETGRRLGVTSFDLYVPGMNYVFGEARCPGRVAVISTYRLRNRSSDGPALLESRVVKEAVHETGHMLGLRHCLRPSCVMYFSERVADTDRKLESFCSECESKLKLIEVE